MIWHILGILAFVVIYNIWRYNQERLVESVADHAKIRKQALSLQNKLKFRLIRDGYYAGIKIIRDLFCILHTYSYLCNPYGNGQFTRITDSCCAERYSLKGIFFCTAIQYRKSRTADVVICASKCYYPRQRRTIYEC